MTALIRGGGYKVKGITEQANILRKIFPGIGYADESIAEQPRPNGAEGWFAIPKWQALGVTRGEAILEVFRAIASKRGFCDYVSGPGGERCLRQRMETAKMFGKFAERQDGFDILVVPAQLGLRHRGRSVRRAREVFLDNEFDLGAFEVGVVLLTHPERCEKRANQLHPRCAGEEKSPHGNGNFSHTPFFYSNSSRLEFRADWSHYASELFGSATAFLV